MLEENGIEVVDIRLRRMGYPTGVREEIFNRIRSERGRKAAEYTSEGERLASDIRTEAELCQLASKGKEPVYLAIATEGAGVVETFMGLLHLTWETLDKTHQLAKKFAIDGETLLNNAARQLGVETSIAQLLGRRVGGAKAGSAR